MNQPLRGLDGRGNFKTVWISFIRRDPYGNIETFKKKSDG